MRNVASSSKKLRILSHVPGVEGGVDVQEQVDARAWPRWWSWRRYLPVARGVLLHRLKKLQPFLQRASAPAASN